MKQSVVEHLVASNLEETVFNYFLATELTSYLLFFIVDDHDDVMELSEDTEDSNDGLILNISEDDDEDSENEFTPDSILERSGVIDESNPTLRNVLAGQLNSGPVDLSHFDCGNSQPNGLDTETQDRCHDYNWCHTEKFPCKYRLIFIKNEKFCNF